MSDRLRSVLLWIFAALLMLSLSVYQRLTGPTTPVRGKIELESQTINYKLLRTWGGDAEAEIGIEVPDTLVTGFCVFKRFKSHDAWDTIPLKRNGEMLIAFLPHQPPAGKILYQIHLMHNSKVIPLSDEHIIIRFKGHVPLFILIPHIIFMFLAMLFSMRTGFEALFIRKKTFSLALLTTAFLLLGGLILGPLVQKYAFGAYWTGWPFGHDLTDNKTAIAFLFWLITILVLRRKRENRLWPVLAAAILLAVYLIPHSVLGSEIDHTKTEQPADN